MEIKNLITTGFSAIDNVTGGFAPTELIVIAGRGRMGKTSFVLSIARNTAVDKKIPIAFFSLKMNMVKLVTLLISNVCEINREKILNGQLNHDEWDRLDKNINKFLDAPLYIDDTSRSSIEEIVEKIQQLVVEHSVKCVIIDRLQLVECIVHNRDDELFVCLNILKRIAEELNIVVIVTSMLGIGSEESTRHPRMSDHSEFKTIDNIADWSVFLWRSDLCQVQSVAMKDETCSYGRFSIARRGFLKIEDGIVS